MLTDGQKGYIAGMIDGEGALSITTNPQYYNGNKRLINPFCYRAMIWVSNTNHESLLYIRDTLGFGKIMVGTSKNSELSRKRIYNFRIHNMTCIKKLLDEILEYLIIKRERAIIMLEYINSRLSKVNLNSYHKPYTKHELDLVRKIRTLNRRGIKV